MSRFHVSTLLCLVAVLAFSGCESVPATSMVALTGDALVDNRARLAAAPPKDRVLWEYRLAATEMRREIYDDAKAKLDDALALAAANYGNVNAQAAKARGLFHNESDKPFVGEPYERVMANYYRGVLYWRDGEPDNGRALFRTAQLIDSDTADKTYAGDYVLLDYLDGLVSAKLGGDGSDALARARANAKQQHRHALPDYDPQANVMCFVEYGRGPRKYQGGEYREQLRFFTEHSRVVSARLEVDGRTLKLPPYDDLNYQATTRGGRVMDYVLGNKAVFKRTTNTVGDVALLGAVGAANYGSRDSDRAAIGLAAVGALSKIASAATTPSADIRAWENLPQYLSFGALRLPPGDHPATLVFADASGQPLEELTQHFTITVPPPDSGSSRDRDVVIFRSDSAD